MPSDLMLQSSRLIPCLLLQDRGLVKTRRFKSPTYIGDPINAVRIFNDLEVDEIIFLDILATTHQTEIQYAQLQDILNECFIPFCYGGGINRIDQIERLFKMGIEKLAINSAAMLNPDFLSEAAKRFGSQSIIGVIEVKQHVFGHYRVTSHRGKKTYPFSPAECARMFYDHGAGEILINAIHKDGMMRGYDLQLIRQITQAVDIPVIACGGAGSLEDMRAVIQQGGAHAAAAGSLFVYYGKEKGVLINYPKRNEIENLFKTDGNHE